MKLLPIILVGFLTVASATETSDTLKAQILLDRAHLSVGEIDGFDGTNTQNAVKVFQELHDLPVTGKADEPTMKLLDDGAPLLTEYVLTPKDVSGPFVETPADMVQKSKLPSLPYASVEEALAEKFQVSPELLKRLNPNALFLSGEALSVPVVGTPLSEKIDHILITKSDNSFKTYDAAGTLLSYYPTTLGSKETPPPYGEWTVVSTTMNPTYLYDPVHGANAGPVSVTVKGGPNNPMGIVWMALSAHHYGIHGTANPSRIGKNESEGCIRLTNWDALEVAAAIAKGVKVLVQP